MTRRPTFPVLILVSAFLLSLAEAAESEPHSSPGIERLQILTDAQGIVPGESITVGLLVSPADGHHTYWRGPGIVGVATSMEWDLPEGFFAGPIFWPTPEKVDMVGIAANGYQREVILIQEIEIPGTIAEKAVELRLKSAWMACSTSCNPGVAELSLTLPVIAQTEAVAKDGALTRRFQSILSTAPPSPPADWKLEAAHTGEEEITLTVTVPGLERSMIESLEFFCDDMQVNSDEPMTVTWLDDQPGAFEIKFARPSFAPREPEAFSGLLKSNHDWPGLESNWVEISIPWEKEGSSHE